MTVAILWTVFSKTARPSLGYIVLNSFQHHLFREIGVSSARLAKAQSSSMAVAASVSSFDPPKESVHIAAITAVAAACTADRWLLSCTWTPNPNKLWAQYRLQIQIPMKLLTTSDTCGYIIQYPSSILFKQLPLDRPPEGRSALLHIHRQQLTCMQSHPPTARPCKTLAPRRARDTWPIGNCSAEPFFTFRTWVCSCVATTTVQITDKTGGYPRRVCRVSRVSVHVMTVAILWTVFSKTARPSLGYIVLNSFQHHLFREIGVSSARLAKAQSSSMAVAASVSSFDPPKESVHIAAITAVAAACTADRWLLSCTWTPNPNKLWAQYRLQIQIPMKLLTTSDTCGYILH